MYCSECGTKAVGKFCSQCGTKLIVSSAADLCPVEVVEETRPADLKGDWSQEVDYQTLLRHADVRERIARAAAEASATLSGEEFLEWCEKALTPFTQVPIPLTAIAKIGQPLNVRLGMKTGKQRSGLFAQPPGIVLVSILCSLARHGRKLKQVQQIEGGCLIEAELGSDMFALAGNLVIAVRRYASGTAVDAATHIPGQLFDWGKSSRCLEQIWTETQAAA